MRHVIFNLLWLDAATDTEPDFCRQVLLYSIFIIALQACLKLHLPHFEETKYRIGNGFGTSHGDFTRFITFREGEVQDWNRIWYFAPRIHTFHHVLRGRSTGLGLNLGLRAGGSPVELRGQPSLQRAKGNQASKSRRKREGYRKNYFRFLQKSN